ncbi:MAG: Asp-tRNA(Asn)/Glu-tRNA(Gln) amidotransferase subunit GatB [Candidatus Latescibacteria bacterium]|nr:Asp-tRNA(Asn)/Glu-tRNA(Gln) amidotransferase subunit GatB [Candidatus Latescibacterota bacterium]
MRYETVIGMEVHVELQTASKIFCPCPADHFQVPANQHICPVCSAQPGALPVLNERAVELTVMTGMALHCQVQPHNIFARKNYVYPDLPKGYQISQYEKPLCLDGWVFIEGAEGPKKIGVERVHLEEDTGKLVHVAGSSLVDLNRAGVPLMEIVSDSSIRSAEEAYAYLLKIRQLVRYLEASSGDMEKGAMRCEANISVRPEGAAQYGTKVEVKNLNSFRSVRNAIGYEVKRQIGVIEQGGQVLQVTMGWDEGAGVTRQQRSKESSEDYRYFPEPDLLEINLSADWIGRVEEQLPELPEAKAARFAAEYGLEPQDIEELVDSREVADYFEGAACQDGVDVRQVGHWVRGEIFRRLKEEEIALEEVRVKPEALAQLVRLVEGGTINRRGAAEVFGVLWEEGGLPGPVVEIRGLKQISDTSAIEEDVAQAIADNPDVVEKVRAGNKGAINFLKGQVMKATRGKANPQLVGELLQQQIEA